MIENFDIKKVNNDFEQTLVDNGYRFFKDNWKKSLRGIQKRFTDDKGTKYFITGYHYNYAIQFPDHESLSKDAAERYSFHVQFRYEKDGKDQTVDTTFGADFLPNEYRPVTTLKDVEDFFEKMFVDFGFDYYELNV